MNKNTKRLINHSIKTITGQLLDIQDKTEHVTFLDYSGHVESLSISIRKSSKNFSSVIGEWSFYIKPHIANESEKEDIVQHILDTLDKFIDEFNKVLLGKSILDIDIQIDNRIIAHF